MNTKTLALAMAIIPAALFAADKESSELQPIIVEATRIDQTQAETPASIQVITREDIATSGAKDIVELMKRKSSAINIHTVGGLNPALNQLSMRGYGESGFGRVLVLVDGEVLNNIDMCSPNLSRINLASVERIEIISAPETVLHGANASAGVINIVTTPNDYEKHSRIEVHGGSYDTYGVNLSTRGGFEELGLQYWSAFGYDHSRGYRTNSQFDIWNWDGGIKENFDNGAYLRFSAFYNYADYGLSGSLSKNDFHADPRLSNTPLDYYKRKSFGLNASALGVINEENRLKLTFTASRRDMDSANDYGWGLSFYDYDMWSYEIRPEWINETTLWGHDSTFILGAFYRYDLLEGAFPNAPFDTDRNAFGTYAKEAFELTEDLTLEFGGRYEYMRSFKSNEAVTPKRTDQMYAYDIGLVYHVIDNAKTYVRGSRFFRIPFIDETANGEMLKSEYGYSVDFGGEVEFLEEFYGGANFFLTRTHDEIALDPFHGLYGWENRNLPDSTLRNGFDLKLGWERDKVAGVSLGYTFVDARFEHGNYKNNKIPCVSESTLLLNGKVWLVDEVNAFGGMRYQSSQYASADFKNEYDKLGDFAVFHLGLQYIPEIGILKGAHITFAIDNLFDKKYCDYAAVGWGGYGYYPAVGRSYNISIAYEF